MKIRFLSILLGVLFIVSCKSTQQQNLGANKQGMPKNKAAFKNYRSAYTKYFNLLHTKIELRPDWDNKEMEGRATLLLKPHFYTQDSLILNARGMLVHSVELEQNDNLIPLNYYYENNLIRIRLDRSYSRHDTLAVKVIYTSRPESLPEGGSAAIVKDKGLYFINPDGTELYKPRQLWTQGETESNSVWFPTIEDPSQRMTQEIYITVDSAYKTLSNGIHLSSINNPDGTRTDYWRQNLPLAPYLSMIAVGDFSVVRDRWKDIEVSCYLDKNYESYAEMIFGKTPEMLDFFSRVFDIEYPWEKYSQVVVHDFVSGAMENNTAVVHGINMQQDPREHHDNDYEDIISHELTHHWFGNLVTSESWSNVTLNEGFASYGEYLWREYKYGRDNADDFGMHDQNIYLRATKKGDAPLVRFSYEDREDLYDAISYQKGARVLHMLRKTVGDEAFFASIQLYLKRYKFNTAEFHELRLVFEEVTGEDLNWFFDQWFKKAGKPSLEISNQWNEDKKQVSINLKQTQDLLRNPLYRLPMDVDFYIDKQVVRKRIVLDSLQQRFLFTFSEEPKLINVDAEKMLLLENKTDNKEQENWIFQYLNAPLFQDRYEAIVALGKNYRTGTSAARTISAALNDVSPGIRVLALKQIREIAINSPESIKQTLINIAQADSSSEVRSLAYEQLNEFFPYKDLDSIFENAIPDYSYLVEATVFSIIAKKNPEKARLLAPTLELDSASVVMTELALFYSEHSEPDKFDYYRRALYKASTWYKYRIINYFTTWLKSQDIAKIKEGSMLLSEIGMHTIQKHIRNNCAASLIHLQNELDERAQEIKKKGTEEDAGGKGDTKISEKELDLIQIDNLKKDIEDKIKAIEQKS